MKLYSQEECIKNMEKAIKVTKKRYDCQAYIPAIGTEVYNYLEDAYLVTKEEEPIVIIGPVREEYTVPVDKFLKTYTLPDGSSLSEEWLREHGYWNTNERINLVCSPKSDQYVFALPVDVECSFILITAWNNKLAVNSPKSEHEDGDRVIFAEKEGKPNKDDMWVVNGKVFKKTYKEIV